MKLLALILLSFGMSCQVIAQEIVIKGRLFNQRKAAIESATIQLLTSDSVFVTGATSNLQGVFSLKSKAGDFKMSISAIGFNPYTMTLKGLKTSVDLGILQMDSAVYALGDVEVVAQQLVHKSDRILVFPTTENKKYANNGYTLLNNLMLPKIDVDLLSNSVTTFGDAVTLCINGRVVKAQEINNLRPKDVLRIEYHDMPAGEFSREKAVINYITVPRESGGYVSAYVSQQPTLGNYTFTGKVYHKKSEYTFIYSPHYKYDNDVYSNSEEIFSGRKEKDIIRMEAGIPSVNQSSGHAFLLGYNHRSAKTQFNLNLEYSYTQAPRMDYSSLRTSSDVDEKIKVSQHVYNRSNSPYLTSFYRYQCKNGDVFEVIASGQYNHNNYQRTYSESTTDESSYLLSTAAKENFYDLNVDVRYSQKFKNKGSLYWNLLHFHSITDVEYRGDNSSKKNLDNGETLIYAIYRQPLGKWTLGGRLGLSYLSYKQKGYERKEYFSPRPSIYVQYVPREASSFRYEAFMGNSNPALSALSDAEQRLDRLQILRGNPDLDNTKYLTQTLDYWRSLWGGSIEFNFRYKTSFHDMRNITLLENNTYIQSFTSDGDSHLLEGTLAYSRRFGKQFQMKVSGGWTRRINTGLNGDAVSYWTGGASGTYFYKAFYFGFSGNTVRNMYNSDLYYSHRGATLNVYGAYNKNNFSFFLGCYNPFWNSNRRSVYQNSLYRIASESFSSTRGRFLYARVSWNISFGKKHNYMKTEISNSSNSAILDATK